MIPGVSIALVDRSGPLWVEGFGYADQPTMRPVQADTVFRVGSLTKTLTALAVMQLQEAGRIDLGPAVYRAVRGFFDSQPWSGSILYPASDAESPKRPAERSAQGDVYRHPLYPGGGIAGG